MTEVTIEPATEEEVKNTVEVMGGDDWELWMNELAEGGVLAPDVTTIAFSYIGSEITKAIYRDGSIGQAKDHLEATALKLNEKLRRRRTSLCNGQQSASDPIQLGDPGRSAVRIGAVQSDEGEGASRRSHRADLSSILRPPL